MKIVSWYVAWIYERRHYAEGSRNESCWIKKQEEEERRSIDCWASLLVRSYQKNQQREQIKNIKDILKAQGYQYYIYQDWNNKEGTNTEMVQLKQKQKLFQSVRKKQKMLQLHNAESYPVPLKIFRFLIFGFVNSLSQFLKKIMFRL